MTAAKTLLPVLGVPVESQALNGLDSLLSIVQMPAGVPVGTLAIGRAGAINAALLAAVHPGHEAPAVPRGACERFRSRQTRAVLDSRIPASPRRLRPLRRVREGRRPRRRPARPDAGVAPATRSASAAGSSTRRRGAGRPRRASSSWAPTTTRRRSTASPTALAVVTYEFENVPVDAAERLAGAARVFPPPRALRGHAGSPGREARSCESVGMPVAALAPGREPRRARPRGRGARAAPPCSRRGASATTARARHVLRDARRRRAGVGAARRRAARSSRASSASTASSRSSPCGASDGADRLLSRWSRTSTRAASCGGASRPRRASRRPCRRAPRITPGGCWTTLDYVGVLAIELFQVGDELLANEMAPRVHNSGHWTIEGAETSQFENHLRAIAGLPLGATAARGASAMLNLIGTPAGRGIRSPGSRRASPPLRQGSAPRPEARPRDPRRGQPGGARSPAGAARAADPPRLLRRLLTAPEREPGSRGDAMDAAADRHRRAAALLCDQRLARTPIEPLPEDCRPRDEPEGYVVQEVLHGLMGGAGQGAVVGHKIGCTTPVMQAYLRIENPCAGGVHATTVHHGQARVRHRDYVRVGVECEIAVRLGSDLGAGEAPFDRARVASVRRGRAGCDGDRRRPVPGLPDAGRRHPDRRRLLQRGVRSRGAHDAVARPGPPGPDRGDTAERRRGGAGRGTGRHGASLRGAGLAREPPGAIAGSGSAPASSCCWEASWRRAGCRPATR